MKYNIIIYILISLFFGIANFIITKDLILSIALCLIFVGFFFFYFDKKKTYYKRNINKSFEAINYINNFIISLSVNPSLVYAFENAKNSASKTLKGQIDAISHLPIEEQVEYLYRYFELPIYGVFINVIKQYVFNGGEILDISQVLIRDSRALEDRLMSFDKVSKRKLKEFISSWALTILILFILNFSLSSIHSAISSIQYYNFMIFIFFIIFLANLLLMCNKIYDISFITKGDSYAKKEKRKNIKIKTKSKKRIFKITRR